jgi:hypothetical protein
VAILLGAYLKKNVERNFQTSCLWHEVFFLRSKNVPARNTGQQGTYRMECNRAKEIDHE